MVGAPHMSIPMLALWFHVGIRCALPPPPPLPAGCNRLGLQAPGEPDPRRECYIFAVGRVAVGADVSGGVGHVPLDLVITCAVGVVAVMSM